MEEEEELNSVMNEINGILHIFNIPNVIGLAGSVVKPS